MQRGIKPEPTQPVELKVPGDDFTRTVNMAAGTELGADQLFACWAGSRRPASAQASKTVSGPGTSPTRGSPVAEVRTVDDYLVRLDALVALPQQPVLPEYLPAMALPEAFDHLGLAWRIATGQRLFHVPRAAVPAKLTQPAASAKEFESRCSALGDMLNSFDFPAEGGSLNNMKARLSDLLGDEAAGRAHAAVDTLRWIFVLRAGRSITPRTPRRARENRTRTYPVRQRLDRRLGSPTPRVVQALAIIREEISPITD